MKLGYIIEIYIQHFKDKRTVNDQINYHKDIYNTYLAHFKAKNYIGDKDKYFEEMCRGGNGKWCDWICFLMDRNPISRRFN